MNCVAHQHHYKHELERIRVKPYVFCMSQFHEFQWRALRTSVEAVEAHRHLPMVVAQRGVEVASPICSSSKRRWISSPMTLYAGINRHMTHSHSAWCGLHNWRCVRLLPQQSLNFATISCHRSNGSEVEIHVQRKQRQGSNRSDPEEGGENARPDAPSAVQRVLEVRIRSQAFTQFVMCICVPPAESRLNPGCF